MPKAGADSGPVRSSYVLAFWLCNKEEEMDREALLKMDPNILVSMINMKLRDFYSNIDLL